MPVGTAEKSAERTKGEVKGEKRRGVLLLRQGSRTSPDF
jgi:hypothetical protein